MRIILACVIVVSFFILGCSRVKEEKKSTEHALSIQLDRNITIAGLTWYTHVESGYTRAKEEHKNVIIMVGEDSCRWCTKMKKGTLTDKRIMKMLQHYVLVSIKRSDKEAIKYVPEFDGKIPSFFFMNHNKELIEPVVGYFKADDFLTYMKEIEEI